MENPENCIEWLTGQHTITCTFSQNKYIKKVKALAEKYPDKVKIIKENDDGSIFCKLPIKSLKLSIIERDLSDEQRAELSKKDAEKALKVFTDVVAEELKKGEKVQLVGFGTFEVSERAAREGRNPRTGKTMKIKASKAPRFKAGKSLKETVNTPVKKTRKKAAAK